jgi:lipid A 3-O-deacylase
LKSLFALLLIAGTTCAQSPSREVALSVDNDYPFMTDQYYTAGIDAGFRFLVRSRIPILHKNDSSKAIFSINAGIKLFTPKDVDTQDIRYMDRPYCGWNYLTAALTTFRRKNSGNVFSLQVGVVGKETGLGQLQQWLHKSINLYGIEGWDSQIADEWVINSSFQHLHGFTLSRNAEIVSTSGAFLGTGLNKLSQDLTLRLFRFNPLGESSFSNAFLSKGRNKSEFFFFASLGVDYTISNVFMEGSLFSSNPSLYTTSVNPWLFRYKVGIQYSGNRFGGGLSITHLGKENSLVSTHNYANANVAYRF